MRFPVAVPSKVLAASALVVSLFAAGCASPAPAPLLDESSADSDFGRPGLYLGLYGIKSWENFDASGNGIHTGDSDLGAGAKIGFRAASLLAVEVFVEDIQGFEVSGGSVESDLDLMNVGAVGKLFLGDGRVQPYLLFGGGAARTEIRGIDLDDDGWFVRAGLGLDIYLTGNFAIFGEANYNRMMGGVEDLDNANLMIGILFRF